MNSNGLTIKDLLARSFHEAPPHTFPGTIKFFGQQLASSIADVISSTPELADSPAENPVCSADLIRGFKSLGVTLCLSKQVHSASIIGANWTGARPEADSIIASWDDLSEDKAIGVFTADCVPLVLSTHSYVSVVHAGWRGLAARILTKTAKALGEAITHCAIGPCAGATKYEVGAEVISALGVNAKYLNEDTIKLDLVGTALAELEPFLQSAQIWTSKACTISDQRFFSYRRDKKSAGRNLLIVSK